MLQVAANLLNQVAAMVANGAKENGKVIDSKVMDQVFDIYAAKICDGVEIGDGCEFAFLRMSNNAYMAKLENLRLLDNSLFSEYLDGIYSVIEAVCKECANINRGKVISA